MDPRDEATFDKIGRAELTYIEEQLAGVNPDDIEISSSDGMLTLALRDGVRVVINTHRAARRIWMAAVASASALRPAAARRSGRPLAHAERRRAAHHGQVR